MPPSDPRIDAIIARAQPFAQPILEHLRALVRTAVPEAEETIKWSMPHFTVSGKILAGMASFKAHAAFFVHGAGRMREGEGQNGGMGSFGKLTSLADLPSDDELSALLRKSRDEIVAGVKPARAPKPPKPEIAMPDDFAEALAASPEAQRHFDAFAPSYRRDYLEWITTAKATATRAKRIGEAVSWIAEGKKRHWKYESC
ncbi:MAG: YdeI/OmpD-associated family protein [Novosphingobium sp.]|nr:YdeI/OmpD-associated family protein [Novosphingobium sp.]